LNIFIEVKSDLTAIQTLGRAGTGQRRGGRLLGLD